MDRGDCMPRGKVADLEREHQRIVHLERIKKIKNRKPGEGTLDNTPPEIIPAMKNNPRKKAIAKEFNNTTLQENKSLLQRISKILTAPPKITDEEYQKMRKLCPSRRGPKELYEEAIVMEHHKKFMEQIKQMKAYYNAKEWEKDYRRQKFKQKFMRQVQYKRPKGFIDPFAPPQEVARATSSSHLNNMRKLKKGDTIEEIIQSSENLRKSILHQRESAKSMIALRKSEKMRPRSQTDFKPTITHNHTHDHGHSRQKSFASSRMQSFQHYDEDEKSEEYENLEQQEELHQLQRRIRINFDGESAWLISESFKNENVDISSGEIHTLATVRCCLLDEVILLISAKTLGGEPAIELESEIELSELAALKGLNPDISYEKQQLEALAKEIASSVEIIVEDGSARLVLNLVENMTGGVTGAGLQSCASEEEIDHMLDYEDEIQLLVRGVPITISHIVKPIKGQKQKTMLAPKPVRETIFAIVKCGMDEDTMETAFAHIFFMENSNYKLKNGQPVINANSSMKVSTGLPSIMQADTSLIMEFFESMATSIVLEHDINTEEVYVKL
jgi:hypothetical protein